MAYGTTTLTGTYQILDGTPASGTIEIIPSESVIKDTAGNVILSGRVKVALDDQGKFSVALPATDDPDLNPTGFGYTVVAKLRHQHLAAVSFALPTGSPVDMEDVTPVDVSSFTPTTTYVESTDLAAVATSGAYADLSGTPTIPSTAADVGAEPAGLSTATQGSLAATFVTAGADHSGDYRHLKIPTYDGDPNVGHPSVVRVEGGWNGYAYWMAFTPYPHESRENPSVVASHNGVDWVVPTGLTNPVVPLSETQSQGMDYSSDVELTLLADGSTMALYYVSKTDPVGSTPNAVERVYRKTSTDGRNWSAAVLCYEVTGQTADPRSTMSPSVRVLDDGTYAMWSVNRDPASSANWIERRTSTDGLTWSAPAPIVTPVTGAEPDPKPWHLYVCRDSVGGYHMLLTSREDVSYRGVSRLYYWKSDNGITWTVGGPKVPLTGDPAIDGNGNYRSCFLPTPGGELGTFDMWVTTIESAGGQTLYNSQWRLRHRRGVRLGFPGYPDHPTAGRQGSVFIPATAMQASPLGQAVQSVLNNRWPVWSFADGATDLGVIFTPELPRGAQKIAMTVYYTHPTTATGTVRFQATFSPVLVGTASFTSPTEYAAALKFTPAPANQIAVTSAIGPWVVYVGTGLWHMRLFRTPTHVDDTMADTVHVFGLRIDYAT